MPSVRTMPRGQENVNSRDWALRQEDTNGYCEIRRCQLERDTRGVKRWLATLSTDHARLCAKRMIDPRNLEYAAALDPLLAMEALRAGFWLKMMHKVISLRFFEVESYWKHIEMTWKLIADGQILTATDVAFLEGKCPRYSKSDSCEIAARIEDGCLFPNADSQWRAGLLVRLRKLPLTTIRSLNTFFDDLRLMEQFVPCIYHIVDKTPRESCDSILQDAYRESSGFETARRKLWRFLLRHYVELPRPPARPKDRLLAKQRPGHPDEEKLHAFATLAHDLGFKSTKIAQLRAVPAERLIATHALLRARKPTAFRADSSHLESIQDAMVQVCRMVPKIQTRSKPGQLVKNTLDRSVYTAGFPDLLSYEREKEHLSEWDADSLQSAPQSGWQVTTLFRLQSLFEALFPPPTDFAGERSRQRDSWETMIPEDSEDSWHSSAAAEEQDQRQDQEPMDQEPMDQEPMQPRHLSPDIVFKELVGTKWTTLRRVETPNRKNVERAANELCRSHRFVAVTADGRIGFIAPADCFRGAIDSGINTVLAVAADPVKATLYDIPTLLHYARFLYN